MRKQGGGETLLVTDASAPPKNASTEAKNVARACAIMFHYTVDCRHVYVPRLFTWGKRKYPFLHACGEPIRCYIVPHMAWVVVGLGNPGEEYEHTRHNAGRMAVEQFALLIGAEKWKTDARAKARISRGRLGTTLVALIEPETFMNRSGAAVGRFIKTPEAAENLIVAYDDIDLPIGMVRVSFDRSAGGHKGLESVIRAAKTKAFPRVRIGIAPVSPEGEMKKPASGEEVEKFVLSGFGRSEQTALKAVLPRAADAIRVIIEEGPEEAMRRFN